MPDPVMFNPPAVDRGINHLSSGSQVELGNSKNGRKTHPTKISQDRVLDFALPLFAFSPQILPFHQHMAALSSRASSGVPGRLHRVMGCFGTILDGLDKGGDLFEAGRLPREPAGLVATPAAEPWPRTLPGGGSYSPVLKIHRQVGLGLEEAELAHGLEGHT